MITASFTFAVLCVLGILLFFSGLPRLSRCRLPEVHRCLSGDRSSAPGAHLCLSSSDGGAGQETKEKLRFGLSVMVITLAYAVLAFWNLGNTESPETFFPMEGQAAILQSGAPDRAEKLALFPGVGIGVYQIEYSYDAEGWLPLETFKQDHVAVLKWTYISLYPDREVPYLRIVCLSGSPWLGEVSFLDYEGNVLPFSCSVKELCDEQATVPGSSTYLNSSYFDEIYHVRTAWEHLNRVWPYELSHPPLGKEIIALGILMFGMTPFGWRFCGTLTGILMLPMMYLFVKRLFHSRRIALLGTLLLACGFLHYVQTRIATVDSFAVLLILLMFYFLFGWLFSGNIRDLALCGITFGIGAACKWICLYAGAGLGVLWLLYWVQQAVTKRQGVLKAFVKNSAFCLLFFVAIPLLIYYLSYLPYGKALGVKLFSKAYTKVVFDNQVFMFQYHANIVAEHPYSSRWYQWIVDMRPILYYLQFNPDGTRVRIAAFVSPLICWGGLLCIPLLLYIFIRRREAVALFLLIAYFSNLVPWMFISRLTFEYHYFAAAFFLIPMLCYIFWVMEANTTHGKVFTIVFTLTAMLLFVCFFPALCGLPVDGKLATKLLGWLPSWPL